MSFISQHTRHYTVQAQWTRKTLTFYWEHRCTKLHEHALCVQPRYVCMYTQVHTNSGRYLTAAQKSMHTHTHSPPHTHSTYLIHHDSNACGGIYATLPFTKIMRAYWILFVPNKTLKMVATWLAVVLATIEQVFSMTSSRKNTNRWRLSQVDSVHIPRAERLYNKCVCVSTS